MADIDHDEIFKQAEILNAAIVAFLKEHHRIDLYLRNQLRIASISFVLSIAEGNGKTSKVEKWNFYTNAREFIQQAVDIFKTIKDQSQITDQEFSTFSNDLEAVSIKLFSLINTQ